MEEIKKESRLGLSLSLKRGRLLVHYATIKALGCPGYIRFLYNSRKKRIAIQICEEIDREAIRVPEKIEGERYQFDISSSPLLSVIYKHCGWATDQTFSVMGTFHEKYHLVEYDLLSAKVISSDQFYDPEGKGIK